MPIVQRVECWRRYHQDRKKPANTHTCYTLERAKKLALSWQSETTDKGQPRLLAAGCTRGVRLSNRPHLSQTRRIPRPGLGQHPCIRCSDSQPFQQCPCIPWCCDRRREHPYTPYWLQRERCSCRNPHLGSQTHPDSHQYFAHPPALGHHRWSG